MSFNGSGLFVINSSGQPVVASTLITAAAMNALTADLATGLSNAICKDGQTTITQNIPFNAKKITGLGAGSARTDAASLATIQDGTGVYVATVGGTADAITLTPAPAIAAYAAGQTFRFLASGANTTNVTVAVSGLAAKAITKNGTTALIAGDIPSGTMVEITYDGTEFILSTPGRDFATITGTETLTNKTLTSPVLAGTPTGSWTSPAFTTPALTGLATGSFSLPAHDVVGALDLSGASAGQISFPASQNQSNGANTLDDYEEGTWTPAVGGTASYTTQLGKYVKIGALVTITCNLVINAIGSGSVNAITGLPFQPVGVGGIGAVYFDSSVGTFINIVAKVTAGSSTIQLYTLTSAQSSMSTGSVLGNGTNVQFTVSYIAAT